MTNRTFVAPIYNPNVPDRAIVFVQMEIKTGEHKFDETRDRKAFEIFAKIASGILERIFTNISTVEN